MPTRFDVDVAGNGPGAIELARSVLDDLFGPASQRPFAVRLWDGSVEGPATQQAPSFTLVPQRPGALRRMLWPPSELALGEAYLRDDFDIEGDIETATGLIEILGGRLRSPAVLARLVAHLRALPPDDLPASRQQPRLLRPRGRRHSRQRDAAAVRAHYDVGNDFYALWLDRRMVYSCAYFSTGEEDIDAAQTAKLEYLCRKLRLKPGERLLDIGCGWGGLVQYAAEHFGVQAVGITLSEPQAALVRQRIAGAGLGTWCRVEVRDYRDLPPGALFDKVVSVGMFEHVGRARLPAYFKTVYRLIRPGGLFLNHGIVTLPSGRRASPLAVAARRIWRPGAFVQRYVFPDGELVTPGEVLLCAEQTGFESRDLERLREHYALTLRHWVRRLEVRHDEAATLVGEPTYRVWRLYMAASARAFTTGKVGVIQVLFSKPDQQGASSLPLTRGDLYQEPRDFVDTGGVQ